MRHLAPVRSVLGVLVAVVVTAGPGAGCSGSSSGGRSEPDPGSGLDRGGVEQEVRERLGESVGREPEDVSCPADLPDEVGRSIRCTLTDAGTTVGVTVVVVGVEGDRATYDVQVDEAPAP